MVIEKKEKSSSYGCSGRLWTLPVAQLDALVSFFASCSSPAIALGLIGRIDRSNTAVGPKQNRFTVLHGSQRRATDRRGQSYAVDTKYRITEHSHGDRPKCRSQTSSSCWSHQCQIIYIIQQQMITPDSPALTTKYCRSPITFKWSYLSWNNS